jgi:hypothetical protein
MTRKAPPTSRICWHLLTKREDQTLNPAKRGQQEGTMNKQVLAREIKLKSSLLRKESKSLQVLSREIALKIQVRTPKKRRNRG